MVGCAITVCFCSDDELMSRFNLAHLTQLSEKMKLPSLSGVNCMLGWQWFTYEWDEFSEEFSVRQKKTSAHDSRSQHLIGRMPSK